MNGGSYISEVKKMTYPVDLEADFRPSPVDPNWLTSSPVTTEAVPYGGQGRSQPTYSTAYGAEATGTMGEQKGKGMETFYPDPTSPDWVHHYKATGSNWLVGLAAIAGVALVMYMVMK